MHVTFRSLEELEPGHRWAELFDLFRDSYLNWFRREGDENRPSRVESEAALREHMPELVPIYARLVELAGGDDLSARLLSLYCPTPYLTACSQAVWSRGTERFLIRNYDYSPLLWEGVMLRSAWCGRPVAGMLDSLWGLLDGVNEAGLVASLAFGGSRAVGRGFGIPLLLRYALEVCSTVREAAEVLARIPTNMAYNVTLLDASGDFATLLLAPDRTAQVTDRPAAANHQDQIRWRRYVEATGSVARERLLLDRVTDPEETPDRFLSRFLEAPLFSRQYSKGRGTLYTAMYEPERRTVTLRWPEGRVWSSTLKEFEQVELGLELDGAAVSGPDS